MSAVASSTMSGGGVATFRGWYSILSLMAAGRETRCESRRVAAECAQMQYTGCQLRGKSNRLIEIACMRACSDGRRAAGGHGKYEGGLLMTGYNRGQLNDCRAH
jgi:hypothetical protein